MKRVLIAVLISACGDTAAIPAPTYTPTVIRMPFSEVDLEPLLLDLGNFPPGVSGSQVRDTLPRMFLGIPEPAYQIFRVFEQGGEQVGGVAILLYEDLDFVETAYGFISGGMPRAEQGGGLGDWSASSTITLFGSSAPLTDLVWRQCHAVVHIRIGSDSDGARAFGEPLAESLEPIACP